MVTRQRWGDTRRHALVALLLLAALWPSAPAVAGQAPAVARAVPKVSLAVIPFSGPAAGVPEGFGEALGEAIRHGLQQVRAVRLVESGAILASGQQLNISVADVLSDEATIRLARDLQVQGLVTGSYSLDGDSLRVQAKIGDVRGDQGGQIVVSEEIAGPVAEFLAGQARITRQLLRHFQVPVTAHDERRLQAAFTRGTSSLETYTLYGRAKWQQ
ncbi:MAG TPA: hypothetical protein VGC81_12150, partial [Candidatus Methylomirabilis sp.]